MRAGWHPDPEDSNRFRWWDGRQWTSATKSASTEQSVRLTPIPGQTAPKTPGERAKDRKRLILTAATVTLIVVFIVGLSVSGSDEEKEPIASGVPAGAIEKPYAKAAPPPPKSVEEISASAAAQAKADENARRREAEAAAAMFDRATYPPATEQEFALLSKNPDASRGKKIVLYSWVTQADANTGTTRFKASAGPTQGSAYEYDLEVVVSGPADQIAPILEGQYVTIYGLVTGSDSFDLQSGGRATFATLDAKIVDITG